MLSPRLNQAQAGHVPAPHFKEKLMLAAITAKLRLATEEDTDAVRRRTDRRSLVTPQPRLRWTHNPAGTGLTARWT
jgi:hypothetical protein